MRGTTMLMTALLALAVVARPASAQGNPFESIATLGVGTYGEMEGNTLGIYASSREWFSSPWLFDFVIEGMPSCFDDAIPACTTVFPIGMSYEANADAATTLKYYGGVGLVPAMTTFEDPNMESDIGMNAWYLKGGTHFRPVPAGCCSWGMLGELGMLIPTEGEAESSMFMRIGIGITYWGNESS